MTIVNKLRKLIKAKGGSPIGVMTIADGVNKLQKMENDANPLSALTIDTDIGASTDLLGKYIADLQKDIDISAHNIKGTLWYIDDYTGFSGDPAEQEGWYLAVHASVPGVSSYTISLKLSDRDGEKPLDMSDGILILRNTKAIFDTKRKLTFIARKTDLPDYSVTLDLTTLTLGPVKPEE